MAENLTSATGSSLIDDLRKIEVFADLPPEQLAWLAEKFEERRFQPGEIMAREGEPLDYLTVILEGEIRRSSEGVARTRPFSEGLPAKLPACSRTRG